MAKNSDLHIAFCGNIRRRRKALGLTQEDVAEALGISQGTYSLLEIGRHTPLLTTVEDIAYVLDSSAEELLKIPAEVA